MRLISVWLAALLPFAGAGQIPKPTDAPKPHTPEESAAAFKLPAGFRMELVASEPLLSSPSAVCWDEHGRMFVSELHGYNLEGQLEIEELNKSGKLDTEVRRIQAAEKFKEAARSGTYGVVKWLRDTNGDGRMDKAEIWATNLPPVYGLVPARRGIIVACAPDIVFLADPSGTGHATTREVLFTGFKTGALERGINAPQWGPDGWIYIGRGWGGSTITGPHLHEPVLLPDSDFRIRADGSAIEPVTGATHTFGFAMTVAGDRFTSTTVVPGVFVAPLPWSYLARNPNAATPKLENYTGDKRAYALAQPHPWRQKRAEDAGYYQYYKSRYGLADSEAGGWFTSACGPLVYQDHALPGLHGQFFVCEPAGNLIHRSRIEPSGSLLELHRVPGEESSEFAASTDGWSHPMNLLHGPDGAIWVVDYYREIIEDYSAIPRHLQQQYGVYAGHDRGRLYRVTHRDAPRAPDSNMSALGADALVRESASALLWRRLTAVRLLVERGHTETAGALRKLLAGSPVEPETIVTILHALNQLKVLAPADVLPLLNHSDAAVRVQALQLADHWFAHRPLLDAALSAAAAETDSRVQIQFALSLGESRDPRAFAQLAKYARERLDVRWMDTAILSSLAGRSTEMLAELVRRPGRSAAFLPVLSQSIAAGGNETDLARALASVVPASPATQAAVLNGLGKGRKNTHPRPLENKSARDSLGTLAASSQSTIRKAVAALEKTFVPTVADDEADVPSGDLPRLATVSAETYAKFVTALSAPRDLEHGHKIFNEACASCHRLGNEGYDVAPDLMGQLGMGEESLLKILLLPHDHIRPGFETTLVKTHDGGAVAGILKTESATSLTLARPSGVETVLLRKDVTSVRRLATSLMPTYGDTLKPADTADLLAWLTSLLRAPEKAKP